MNKMTPQDVTLVELLAYNCLRNARPDEAALLLSAAVVLATPGRKMLRTLALAQLRSGQPQRALQTLEGLAIGSNADAAYHLIRARSLVACDRRIEAREAMAACLAIRRAQLHEKATA